jgi:carboxylesterase
LSGLFYPFIFLLAQPAHIPYNGSTMTKQTESAALLTVPGAEPSLLPAGPTSCLLIHGFSANPEEMQFLAGYLHERGYTVLNLRLAGHGTHPADLKRTRWTDWLLSVEDGLNLLRGLSRQTVLIGQSMGGMIALAAAVQFPVTGVVALSTPYFGFPMVEVLAARLMGALGMTARKDVKEHPELGQRREVDYPAYPRYPVRIIVELARLNRAMRDSLQKVKVPALVVQSRQDLGGRDDLERIHTALGSSVKEKLWLDGFDHSVVRDGKRQVLFDAIGEFLKKIELNK